MRHVPNFSPHFQVFHAGPQQPQILTPEMRAACLTPQDYYHVREAAARVRFRRPSTAENIRRKGPVEGLERELSPWTKPVKRWPQETVKDASLVNHSVRRRTIGDVAVDRTAGCSVTRCADITVVVDPPETRVGRAGSLGVDWNFSSDLFYS